MSLDNPLKITIHLDGSGIYYDPFEPPMLDSLLGALLCRWQVSGEPPARDEEPAELSLPCGRWRIGGEWGWRCSALFPEGDTAEGLIRWRKRFRESRAHLIESAAPNLTNATYRAWDMPLPLLLAREMVAYAVGDRRAIRRALKDLKYLGKKRAHGRGHVLGVDVERVEYDYSTTRDGRAQRWLPSVTGQRLVRPRPPYWSSIGRMQSCEIGDVVSA